MPAPDEFTLLCERCGYEIESLPRDEECPECGKPIAESLPERRAGTPWQIDPSWTALLHGGWTTIRTPLATLDVMRADFDLGWRQTRRFGLLAGAVASLPVLVWLSVSFPLIGLLIGFALAPIVTLVIALTIVLLTAIEARGIQFFAARRGGRLTSAMAWSICGHGGVGWVIASLGISVGASAGIAITLSDSDEPAHTASLALAIGGTLLLIGGLAGFLFFETFAWLGVRRCKFANRARPNHPEQHTTPAPNDQTPANRPS